MDLQAPALLQAIRVSPILTDAQRDILLAEISRGDPYSEQLQTTITEFTNAVILYEIISEEMLKEEVEELEKEISALPQNQATKEDIQERAKKIIALTQRYIQEIKKMEKDFEGTAENILQTAAKEGEGAQAESIRSFLKQPKQ